MPSTAEYRKLANQCLALEGETTDEQHKSVLLRAAARLNELADQGQHCRHPKRRAITWHVASVLRAASS